MKVPVLLAVSLWRAVITLADEVRRSPTATLVTMLGVVVIGTLLAILVRAH